MGLGPLESHEYGFLLPHEGAVGALVGAHRSSLVREVEWNSPFRRVPKPTPREQIPAQKPLQRDGFLHPNRYIESLNLKP